MKTFALLIAFLTLASANAWAKGPCPTEGNAPELYSAAVTTAFEAEAQIRKLTESLL